MGLTLLYGRAGSGKSHTCFEQIRSELRRSPEGQALLLILPEQATFQAERELATQGILGFMRAHVLGFRRLAHRVLLETGGAARPRMNDLGRRMLLRSLLLEHAGEWKVFQRAAQQRGFCDTVADMLSEFKHYCISPAMLSDVGERLPQGELANKLYDLSLLYSLFHDLITDHFTDPDDVLTLLTQKIAVSKLLAGSQIWVDGFHFFTPQEYGVLEQLLRVASQLTVTLCLPQGDDGADGLTADLFYRQRQTRQRLLELAQSTGAAVDEQFCGIVQRFHCPALGHLEQQLVNNGYQSYQDQCDCVRVIEAANRRVEVEAIARDVIRLVREQHYRYRDIAVLVRDLDHYIELIETVFTDYDIPLFSDRQRPVIHHPLAELIRSSLEVKSQNWAYDPVFRCLKTDLFPALREDIDLLENYVLEFGIRGSQWRDLVPWYYRRSFGLDEQSAPDQAEQQLLERIQGIRMRVSQPLLVFCDQLDKAETIEDYCVFLYRLLDDLHVAEILTRWADEQEQLGLLDKALEHRQLWDGIVELLDQLVEGCGQRQCTIDDFQAIISEGLETLSFRLIPPGLDHVTLGPLERSRPGQILAAYLPGIQEGILPLRARDEGIIDDYERQLLSEYHIQLAPGAEEEALTEQFLTYTALTRASDYLWVSYSLADEEGEGLTPSPVIRRLCRICGISSSEYIALEPPLQTEQDYVAHPHCSLAILSAGLRRFRNNHSADPAWWGWDLYNFFLARPLLRPGLQTIILGLFHRNAAQQLPVEQARELFLNPPKPGKQRSYLRGSVTRFESYSACPFRFFVQYGLNLRTRALYRLGAPDLGQFLHAGMQRVGETLLERKLNWGDLDIVQAAGLCHEIAGQLAPKVQNEILLSSRQMQAVVDRLERRMVKTVTRLAAFDRVSGFKPLAFELGFGDHDGLGPLLFELDGKTTLALHGRIDRVDTTCINGKHYILLFDYKSGGKFFSLSAVMHGIKLQLLTYLLALHKLGPQIWKWEDCSPAGVLYCFLQNPLATGKSPLPPEQVKQLIDRHLKMPGWLLDDEQVMLSIDHNGCQKSQFLAIKRNQLWPSTENFHRLLDYVEQKLRQIADNVLEGVIDIAPCCLDQFCSCSYCDYRPVCQFDGLLAENQIRQLSSGQDQQVMQLLDNHQPGKGETAQ